MRDLHCHILPDVDDGAVDLSMSLRMLEAARSVGIDEMVCTPHANSPWFDYIQMVQAFDMFRQIAASEAPEMHVSMGFEVAHRKLVQLGVKQWASYLRFAESSEILLELDPGCVKYDFRDYERTIYELQGQGLEVVIAHPERYRAIQEDVGLARGLVGSGCKLQASASFVAASLLSKEKRCARKLFSEGLYSYVASDAHRPKDYALLPRAIKHANRLGPVTF